MQNPWTTLKKVKNEYVAECDRAGIKEFMQPRLEGFPGPYTGDPKKSVVYILALNPGYDEGENEIYEKDKDYFLRNLTHQNTDWPFMSLSPVFENTPGGKWWKGKLKHLIKVASQKIVARFVFNAEYFPYHSKTYTPIDKILPSQEYTFSLVKKAVKDGKIIVIMRSKKLWYKAVPELENYENLVIIKNPRSPALSVTNMGQENFDKIVEALKKAAKKAGLKPDA